jgi:hypothetical protein
LCAENSILIPAQIAGKRSFYLVRTSEGQLAGVAKAAPNALLAVSHMRILSGRGAIRTFAQVRADAYRDDKSLAIMMGIVSVVLLTITAGGIVGFGIAGVMLGALLGYLLDIALMRTFQMERISSFTCALGSSYCFRLGCCPPWPQPCGRRRYRRLRRCAPCSVGAL